MNQELKDLLAGVVITDQLSVRIPRARDEFAEEAAMQRISAIMAVDPSKTFEACAELGLSLCRADTCGVSLRERSQAGEDVFRWIALTGELKHYLHGTTPRYYSPCGVCVDSGRPLLMTRPELVYKYLDVGPPFHDVLLIPLTEADSKFEATIWVVAHTQCRKFDSQDAIVMRRLAAFIAMALKWRSAR